VCRRGRLGAADVEATQQADSLCLEPIGAYPGD